MLDVAAARSAAIKSCHETGTFLDAARANQASPEVFRALDGAIASSRAAVDAHPHWVRLLSGLEEVRYALEHDDPAAAASGMALVSAMCAEAGAPLPPQ